MRYMIRFAASIEQGARVDASAGGAGATIGKVIELFKPEAFYVSVFNREITMIVNSEDVAALAEAAHFVQLVAGATPEVTPVMAADEAMAIIPAAVGRAVQSAKVLGF